MRLRHLLVKSTTVVAALAVSATAVTAMSPVAAAADSGPAVQRERSVPGAAVKVEPLPSMAMPSTAAAPVVWPGAARAQAEVSVASVGRADTGLKRVGDLPVHVGLADKRTPKSAKVAVETLDRQAARKAGVTGVLVRLSDAGGAAGERVSVRLDYQGFAAAFGGDFGARLGLSVFPECVVTTPERPECRVGTPLPTTNDPKAKQVSAEVPMASTAVVAASAGTSGSGGSFGATDLAASGSWSAGTSSGDFTYSVPLSMPVAPGGPAPQLALGYSSGSVDGRTSVTNNQASWVGDGWDLSAGGFVERAYTGCAQDEGGNQGSLQTGDLCWKDDQYTVSLGGMSGKLIKDSVTGKLRPEKDDGSRIEKLAGAVNGDNDGEYWKVTTPAGTQYFLGLNRLPGWVAGKPETNSAFTVPVYGNHAGEPCHQATFAGSSCTQAYRWNVDLVVDPRGNAMVFSYSHEINHYKRGGTAGTNTAYVAAGRLDRIEYGLRNDNLFGGAPARVAFEVAERCLPSGAITCDPAQLTEANAGSWPDVPFDRICAAGEDCTGRYSPAFFTRKRLTKVVTSAASPSDVVDSWVLRQEFPPVETGEPGPLWLSGVTRTGHVGGTVSLPETQFFGEAKDNRVDALEGLPPISRYRLTRIAGEAGALTQVTYAEHDCDRATRMPANPESNSYRCYPVWWTPEGQSEPILDWFHKYVVTHVTEDARTGGPSQVQTHFDYVDGAAWHYDDNDEEDADKRTWSDWRGFGRVRTTKGAAGTPQTITESLFLRGMDGDTLPGGGTRDVWVADGDGGTIEDERRLQGFTRETLLYSGGQVVSASVNEPHLIETANDGEDPAFMVRVKAVSSRSKQEDGSWRRMSASTTYNELGLPVRAEDLGDTAVSGDESCAETTYLRNDAAWMLVYASRVRSIARPCAAWPGVDADVVSDVKSFYDGQGEGAAPTRGEVTESRRWIGGTTYQTVGTTKNDAYGRVIESTDHDGAKTSTVYTPATGTPTKVTVTNRMGWVTESTVDPRRGTPLTEVGVNGERADLAYDPLGRLSKVWLPGRDKATKSPNAEYAYDYRTDAPTVVTTKSLKENETYAVSYDLLDGFLRERQTQTPGLGGGRILTDNFYDSRGQTFKITGAYYNLDAPTNALHGVLDNAVPNQTVTEYDDLGRPLETILKKLDVEQWRTKTRYGGDNTYTTPPQGDTATAVFKDARGRITERRQYHARSATGSYGGVGFDATTYAFTGRGQLARVTDPQGNQWTYDYDHLGRKIADQDPDRGRSTYAYDTIDQLTSTTDARGKTLAYSYDSLGRKTGLFDGSTAGTKLAEWVFDSLRKGMPTSSTRFADGHGYTQKVDNYDALGRATSSSVVIPAVEGQLAGTFTFGASYSAITSQLLRETVPAVGGLAAEGINHTYNDLGLPESSYGLNTYASEHLYSPYGETLRTTLGVSPNKVWVSSSYTEGTRRLDNVQVKRDTTTQSQVTNRSFSYDPAGNVTKIADTPLDGPADTQCFGYDHLRRMSTAWTPKTGDCAAAKTVANLGGAAPYWFDFTFDKIGNRLTQTQHKSGGDTTETYTVPASGAGAVRPHTLTSVKRVTPTSTQQDDFTYDATGNTITRKLNGNTQTLDWNTEGRVSKITESGGQTSTYLYDAAGSRLIKKEPGRNTLYLPGHELILNLGSTPTVAAKRYYSHGGATVALRDTVAGLQYMLGDHHGTDDVAITASNGYVTRRYSDPFGNTRGTSPRFWPDDKGFVGGTKDTTGLTSIGAREYDPRTGRFISVDPIMDAGDPQQIHGYAYGNNAPATFSDPTGLAFCLDDQCRYIDAPYSPWTDDKQAVYDAQMVLDGATRDHVVASTAKVAQEQGMSAADRARLEEEAKSKDGFWEVVKTELPDILGDLTGYNDVRDCFTKGDIWACAGLIPWAKIAKLVKTAGKLADAINKAIKWEERVAAARQKLKAFNNRVNALIRQGTPQLDELKDKLADAKRKAADGASCPIKHSFPPGTLVLMADGSTKPIEQIQLGDTVLATDPETGESGARQVTATWVHDDEPERTELTVDTDGKAGNATATITATDWHPFWVVDLQRWVPIADVQVGSTLQSSGNSGVVVEAVRQFDGQGSVYDLTVDGVHTYHVISGDVAVLVHNCGDNIYKVPDDGAKHGKKAVSSHRGDNSAEPTNGQAVLDNSVQIKPTSYRRVGFDPASNEIVILDRTETVHCGCTFAGGVNTVYHGHVRSDFATSPAMQLARNALKKGFKSGAIGQ